MIPRTPVKKARKGLRRGELSDSQKEAVRHQVYVETGGKCELRLHPDCKKGVLPEFGETPWDHWHLVHLRNKRMWGWGRSNLKGGCHVCHLIVLHQYGPSFQKPCPPKTKEVA